jgi:putative tricarboxylic transport membrane protein
MQDDKADQDEGPPLVSTRTIEIAIAVLFMIVSAVVIVDSVRLGFGWQEGQGPAPGYFPFYVAVIMALSSCVILFEAARDRSISETFVTKTGFARVLAVLLPAIGFVALIQYLGIYVASTIFIAGFMIAFGRENPAKAAAVGLSVALALFFMFERWFLVPLPKGPLEAMLGVG